MKNAWKALVVVIAVLASTSSAFAGACQANIEQLCADAKSGGEVMKCLRGNEDKLSSECKAYLGFFENIPSCVADADKLCGDPASGAAVLQCLRGRQTDLSNKCKAELRNIR